VSGITGFKNRFFIIPDTPLFCFQTRDTCMYSILLQKACGMASASSSGLRPPAEIEAGTGIAIPPELADLSEDTARTLRPVGSQ
jgi:hypothetical protein